jgi:hypothetical protein
MGGVLLPELQNKQFIASTRPDALTTPSSKSTCSVMRSLR